MTDPKHISQLAPAKRALMQQHIQEALLTIVAAQGASVTIPVSALEAVSERYRLKIEIVGDEGAETLVLTPEEYRPEIIKPTHEIISSSRN